MKKENESQETKADTQPVEASAVELLVMRLTREILDASKDDLMNHSMDFDGDFGPAIKIIVFNIVRVMCVEMENKK